MSEHATHNSRAIPDFTAVNQTRRAIDEGNAALTANTLQLAQARALRDRLASGSGTVAQIKAQDAEIARLIKLQRDLTAALDANTKCVREQIEQALAALQLESRVTALQGNLPVMLLPVRLETRFVNANTSNSETELRIRIYPDQMHVNRHEPELTPAEDAAARWYWTERWEDASALTANGVWTALANQFGPARAAWMVRVLTPTNLSAIGTATPPQFSSLAQKADAWTRAAYAMALPDRWVAIGYQGDIEVFRKWGNGVPDTLPVSPAPDPADLLPPPPDNALPIDEPMRWVTDYDAALAVGMAITVRDVDLVGGNKLANGVTRLVVLGVDWTLSPEQTAASVAELFQGHLYTDELAFVPPGSPTNNTGAVRAGLDQSPAVLLAQFDPNVPVPTLAASPAASLVSQALGMSAEQTSLQRVPGATLREQDTASHMLNALWRATLGYYLDELFNAAGDAADSKPLMSDQKIAQAREHVVKFLRPGGPLPTLRVGKQPYGILPVVAHTFMPTAQDPFSGDLHNLLSKLRPFWARGVGRVPRLAHAANRDQLEATLLEMLRTTPLSSTARFRRSYSSALVANGQGLNAFAELQADVMNRVVGPHLGWTKPPRLTEFVSEMRSYPLPAPWVQPNGVSDSAPLADNYIQTITTTMRTSQDARAALSAMEQHTSLLQTLLAHAALEEIDDSAGKFVDLQNRLAGALTQPLARKAGLRSGEMTFIEPLPARQNSATPQTAPVFTRREMAQVILPRVNPNLTVSEHVSAALRSGALTEVELANLAEFLQSLEVLRTRPSAELERAFVGAIDCYSHRLDAWYTSLATRQLSELRKTQAAGLYVGGYGCVENLKPDTQPDSLGYLHAPSLPQAMTAAVLRSGHLSHQTGDGTGAGGQTPFNIDMRSERVRGALTLLNGAAQGQPLAALLGYRFERALRERKPTLARFILPFRVLFPLRPDTNFVNAPSTPSSPPTESVAVRDVVDGVTLLERWRNERATVLSRLTLPPGADAAGLSAELDRLADLWDAASDVMMAEAVYQTVQGNYERAGAVLATLDRQERPPEPAVVKTPRTGRAYSQRVMILLGSDAPAPGWGNLMDARARAEPRLNTWVGALLGLPAHMSFAARVLKRADASAPPVEVRRLSLPVNALRLSPLSLMFAAAAGGQQQPSELEERLAQAFSLQVTDGDANTSLELLDEAPPGANLAGLGMVRAVLGWIRNLLSDRRAIDGRDLAVPSDLPEDGLDVADLAARANALKAEVVTSVTELTNATTTRVRRDLENAIVRAAPLAAPNTVLRSSAVPALIEQATAARDHLQRVLNEMNQAEQAVAGQTLTPENAVAHHTERIRLVFGKAFPVLPRFVAGNAGSVAASLKDKVALCANEPLNLSGWLRRMALARPGVDALSSVLSGAALMHGLATDPTHFAVAQLPHRPGQRWLALPEATDASPKAVGGEIAMFAHVAGALDVTKPLAGLMCDEWIEMLPNDTETTGVSFHYDAPGARPPQVIILAVPPDLSAPSWTLQTLLDTVSETLTLSQLRMVGPKDIEVLHGNLLPAVYLPQNAAKDVPSVDLLRLRNLYKAQVRAAGVLGKEIL